jgi:hypothetical protein
MTLCFRILPGPELDNTSDGVYFVWDRQGVSCCRATREAPSMGTILPVPSTVRIFHRRAGHVHIFTSPELRGLHVGHSDLEQAFALIPEAVSGLVELETGIEATYEPEAPYEQFRLKVSDDGELDLASPVLLMKVGAIVSLDVV